MKINISRHYIYMLLLSFFLFLFVLLFAFFVLIPNGKEYRESRLVLQKTMKSLHKYENFHDETMAKLKELKSKNKNIITAFDNIFNPDRFEKKYKSYFSALTLSKISKVNDENEFAVYEVNTTSQISSPKNFYDFLDALNKSDWIIGVNFPINFKREGEMIKSSFTMKVYCNNRDTNATASESNAK
ncbi:hypothetical protein [Sulfurimonas sp.]|uniref:hypothetical protein n=1 Tax=Sulfurimonas sp. TaxID=2022749 RepID=UPI002612E052|nr:hypothetical protein [Sulfurimonas sp.]